MGLRLLKPVVRLATACKWLKVGRRAPATERQASGWNSPFLEVSEEVQAAVNARKPVVALETTIYTHGFPYPENSQLAIDLESLVRKHGATPATIGVLNGVARVGLTASHLNELTASAGKPDTRKLSRRDIAYICGMGIIRGKLNGGTTVSGTMLLAHLAGIKIFATGGLGGVHRGGENSMDISADLTELGRTPVAVISSGCKSFLDIPRTLEYLETQGVGVATFSDGRYGDVEFPAFWTRESGVPSPLTIQNEKEAAAIIYAQFSLGLSSGFLFANPIPERFSIPRETIDSIMFQAIQDAEKGGVTGSENTPFMLSRIREITHGDTVIANRSLVEENIIRGTRVAVELAMLELEEQGAPYRDARQQMSTAATQCRKFEYRSLSAPSSVETSRIKTQTQSEAVDVLIAGALAIDSSCDFIGSGKVRNAVNPHLATSNPALITQNLGGVGQNIATALHYLGTPTRLCSIVGDDVAGASAFAMLSERGLSTSGIQLAKNGSRTAQYVAINNSQKDLFLAMADMRILEGQVDFDSWKAHVTACRPKWLVVDANWDSTTLQKWIIAGKASGAKVAYEPVSVAKSQRLFAPNKGEGRPLGTIPHHAVDLASPNRLELASMYAAAREEGLFEWEDWWQTVDAMGFSSSGSREKLIAVSNIELVDEGIPQQSIQLLPFIPTIVTKLGHQGVLLTRLLPPGDSELTSRNAAPYILSRSHHNEGTVGGVFMRLFPAVELLPEDEIISVNGVGDTFLGTLIAGLARDNSKKRVDLVDIIDIAQRGSVMSLKSKEAVSPEIALVDALDTKKRLTDLVQKPLNSGQSLEESVHVDEPIPLEIIIQSF